MLYPEQFSMQMPFSSPLGSKRGSKGGGQNWPFPITCQLEVENLHRQTHNAASEIELLHLVLSNHIFASF